MKKPLTGEQQRLFCRTYLHTMDPQRAAGSVGRGDGFALLRARPIRQELERMRDEQRAQILREDAVRRLCELSFGRANDAVALAVATAERSGEIGELDLSAVSECKFTDKGVELKFIDRVRALEALCRLLDGETRGDDASDFFQALEDAGADA